MRCTIQLITTHNNVYVYVSNQQFEQIEEAELPAGYELGYKFKTVTLRPALYLSWLKGELVARGVRFVKRRVSSIREAACFEDGVHVVVNATGLGKFCQVSCLTI